MSELISIVGLNKSYGKKHVVTDVNLSIHAGQIVGLVGPNGAGKTTCLQSLLGLRILKARLMFLDIIRESIEKKC